MTGTYEHYTVHVENEDGEIRDPRDALNDPFLQSRGDTAAVDIAEEPDGDEAADSVDEAADEGFEQPDEGHRIKEDNEFYFFVFDQIFPNTESSTTIEAFCGKAQRNRENRLFEAEVGEVRGRLEDIVDARDLAEAIESVNASEIDEEELEDWTTAIPEDSAARMGVLYRGNDIHILIEDNQGAPGIKKTKKFLEDYLEDEGSEIKYTAKTRDFSDEPVSELLDTTLKEATLSFKRNPSEYVSDEEQEENKKAKPPEDGEEDGYELAVKESLAEATPKNYRLKYTIVGERRDNEKKTVRTVVSDILGLPENELEEALTDPAVRDNFYKIELIGKRDNDEDEIDITFTIGTDKERIDDLGDEFVSKELGDKLIEKIRERINTGDSDGSEPKD